MPSGPEGSCSKNKVERDGVRRKVISLLVRTRALCPGQREPHTCATIGTFVIGGNAPAMRLDDRTADGEAHAQATVFGGEEGFKQSGKMLGPDARAAVFDAAMQGLGIRRSGAD